MLGFPWNVLYIMARFHLLDFCLYDTIGLAQCTWFGKRSLGHAHSSETPNLPYHLEFGSYSSSFVLFVLLCPIWIPTIPIPSGIESEILGLRVRNASDYITGATIFSLYMHVHPWESLWSVSKSALSNHDRSGYSPVSIESVHQKQWAAP